VTGSGDDLNQSLEKAGRVADFLELGELLCIDALERMNRAAGTFVRSIRRRMARRSADDEHSATVAA